MSFKNKLIEIKNKYLTRNSLTTKFSLYYRIILIVILGISLSMGVIGVLLHRKWHRTQSITDVSHELKTPISVISGYANLLDRWGKDDAETCNKSIQAIKNETKNMNELVSKLLYITKADTGKVNLS